MTPAHPAPGLGAQPQRTGEARQGEPSPRTASQGDRTRRLLPPRPAPLQGALSPPPVCRCRMHSLARFCRYNNFLLIFNRVGHGRTKQESRVGSNVDPTVPPGLLSGFHQIAFPSQPASPLTHAGPDGGRSTSENSGQKRQRDSRLGGEPGWLCSVHTELLSSLRSRMSLEEYSGRLVPCRR